MIAVRAGVRRPAIERQAIVARILAVIRSAFRRFDAAFWTLRFHAPVAARTGEDVAVVLGQDRNAATQRGRFLGSTGSTPRNLDEAFANRKLAFIVELGRR